MIVLLFQFGKVSGPCVRCRQRGQPMRKDRRELQAAGRDARKGIIKDKLEVTDVALIFGHYPFWAMIFTWPL